MDEKGVEITNTSEPSLAKESDKRKQGLPSSCGKEEKWVQDYIEEYGTEPSFF